MTLAKIKDTDYLFSTARVRSVEKNMITRERAEKMIDAKSAEDAIKVLYDCDYGYGEEVANVNDFDKLLAEEHKKTYEFIMSIAPEIDNFNIFLYPYDYHNLKVLMKSEYLGKETSDSLVDTGSIEINKLKYAVRERDFSELTENMANALKEVIETFPKNKDPQSIDIIFDTYLYDEMLRAAQNMNSEFVLNYIKMQIDIINIKTFVRLRKMGKSWDFFSKVFIEGGNIYKKTFISSYDESYESFADQIFIYDFKEIFLEGIESLNKTGTFTNLEQLFDNKLMNYIKSAKFIAYGIEPLVSYLIAKENEIKIARIIMAGKIAGISSEKIRERMRETYA